MFSIYPDNNKSNKSEYEFIILDESTIRLNNNNYKLLGKSNEQIYFGIINKPKNKFYCIYEKRQKILLWIKKWNY